MPAPENLFGIKLLNSLWYNTTSRIYYLPPYCLRHRFHGAWLDSRVSSSTTDHSRIAVSDRGEGGGGSNWLACVTWGYIGSRVLKDFQVLHLWRFARA